MGGDRSVPVDALPERTIALPLAAEADLVSVLRYEMDTITPCAVEELFWTWSVVRPDRERRRVHVRVSLAPKIALPSLSVVLEGLATAPSRLEAATPAGTPRVIPLGYMAASEQRRRRNLFGRPARPRKSPRKTARGDAPPTARLAMAALQLWHIYPQFRWRNLWMNHYISIIFPDATWHLSNSPFFGHL
jgi:hypothetical protein